MKKLVLICFALLVLTVGLNAQSGFRGFFRPVDQVLTQELSARERATTPTDLSKPVFLPRLSLSVVGFGVQFGGGAPRTQSFNSAGLGVSVGQYSDKDDRAYCDYSFNAALLTGVNITGSTEVRFGVMITGDVFDKLLGLGLAYLDGHPMLVTTFSFSF